MACRLVVTDGSGAVLSSAADLWNWLGCPPPSGAAGRFSLSDIATALPPALTMNAMALADGRVAHVIHRKRCGPGGTKSRREALRRENALLRETLDAVDGSIVVHDAALRFRLSNKGYHAFQPHLPPAGELVGRHYGEVLRMSIRAGSYADRRAVTDTEAYIAERIAKFSNRADRVTNHYQVTADRWSQIRVRWTPSGNRVTLRVDITQDKRMEEELVRSQRIQTIGRIAGGIAHHFNNLLTVVCASIELLLQVPDLPGKAGRLAGGALASAERGGRLTRQLLTFARRDITNPHRVDPNRMLDGIAALLEGALGSGATLALRLDDADTPVLIDPAKFETAMLNLILNARDAIAGRADRSAPGQVEIRTSSRVENGRPFRVVAVADNGEGMTPDVAAEAFEPFFTTRQAGLASGLGLSEVHGFATGAGGAARIRSTPGQGTVVEMLLPEARA